MKEKHKYGQYFTKAVVAEYMVSLISQPKDCRVLEPSCGEGVFLSKLKENGFSNYTAYEIDTELAKTFANVQYKSFLSVPTDEKYDVVIGNPPYIRWKNLEDDLKKELAGNALWNHYFNSLCDYLFIFILKSIEHLNEDGELIFICSDYWMNSTHAASLRNYMVANGYFEKIFHFKEANLFEGVNASFVIFKYRKSCRKQPGDIRLLTYTEKSSPSLETLMQEASFIHETIPQFKQNERWLLATREMQDELQWFESVCVKHSNLFGHELHRLGDVCDIGNGMVSGLDAAFHLDKETENHLNELETKHSIQVLKAKNLSPYKYTETSRYIYMPSGVRQTELEQRYPHFAAQLEPYIDTLKHRYSYGRELPYWEFAFPRSKALFERNEAKIFIPCKERISHKHYFRFCYAPTGFYPLQDVTAIVRKADCRESVEYILAYLNSRYVYDWLRHNGIVKGEIVEFSEAPLSSIPFRRIDWTNDYEVAIHDAITTDVHAYLTKDAVSAMKKIDNNIKRLLHDEHRLQEIA